MDHYLSLYSVPVYAGLAVSCVLYCCDSCRLWVSLGFVNTEMDTMALAARERERKREHPTASSVLLRPATRGVARSWSPHETNPTSGGRDGMEIPSPALASKPPTTTQGGIAPCAVRRQSVDDRQDNRELVRGIAKNYRDGEERVRHCPPDRTWSSAKSPEALPVETDVCVCVCV